jgi:hypothetical protein
MAPLNEIALREREVREVIDPIDEERVPTNDGEFEIRSSVNVSNRPMSKRLPVKELPSMTSKVSEVKFTKLEGT